MTTRKQKIFSQEDLEVLLSDSRVLKKRMEMIYDSMQHLDFESSQYNPEKREIIRFEVEDLQDQMSINFNEYNQLHKQIERISPDHMENMECRLDVDKMSTKVRVECKRLLYKIKEEQTHSHHNHHQQVEVRLPKMELPKFAGDVRGWPAFKNLFLTTVDVANIPTVTKLQYLKSALQGDAAALVSSLLMDEQNYTRAMEILSQRYENKVLVLNYYLKNVASNDIITKSVLKEFLINFQQSLDSLRALELPVSDWDVLLMFLVVRRLDGSLRSAWELSRRDTSIPALRELLDFLSLRMTAMELTSDRTVTNKQCTRVANLVSQTQKSKQTNNCILCYNQHALYHCPKYLKMSIVDRINFVRSKALCYNCLKLYKKNHICSLKRCFSCNRKHHTTLHNDNHTHTNTLQNTNTNTLQNTNTNTLQNTHTNTLQNIHTNTPQNIYTNTESSTTTQLHNNAVLLSNTDHKHTLLSTAIILLQDSSGNWKPARALLDSGSEISLITNKLAVSLGLQFLHKPCIIKGISNTHNSSHLTINTMIASRYNNYRTNISLTVLDNITIPLPHTHINTQQWNIKQRNKLADPTFNIPGDIDVLIGAELFYDIVQPERILIGQGHPLLIKTVFGWVISGSFTQDSEYNIEKNVMIACDEMSSDNLLQRFWEQEEVKYQKVTTPEQKHCETVFAETTVQDDQGRYTVNLPLNEVKLKELGNSFNTAYHSLIRLERRFEREPEFYLRYKAFIEEFLELGHAHYITEFGPTDPDTYYLPHHAILKPDKRTTKLRTVFNGSAKTSSGISLNDVLCDGPNIYNEIFDILLRFRLYNYVFSCDIVKMFRCILVNPKQRSLQRVLWREPNASLKCLELSTVTYGTKSAPYLACRVLRHLAHKHEQTHKLAADCILYGSYMDDFLCGGPTREHCIRVATQLTDLLNGAGFRLHKWSVNDRTMLENILTTDAHHDVAGTDMYDLTPNESVKTLGLNWIPSSDTLKISIPDLKDVPNTKRNILSQIAKIFDPLGFLAPSTIILKLLMQDIWRENNDWDSVVSKELEDTWVHWYDQLEYLKSIQVQRCYFNDIPSEVILVGFCDASVKAYGACLYLRATYPNKPPSSTLVMAKTKVAPIRRKQSIPRLELCGALLLVQCKEKFVNVTEHQCKITKMIFLTDSTTVLNWIKSPYAKLNTYVTHRLMEIIEGSSSSDWYYVGTKQNPADVLTRGSLPRELVKHSVWWNGPKWLIDDFSLWPITNIDKVQKSPVTDSELKTLSMKTVHTASNNDTSYFYNYFKKHSSLFKLLRVIAYIKRFVHNTKNTQNRLLSCLSVLEIQRAHDFIVGTVQKQYFSIEILELRNMKSLQNNTNTHTQITPLQSTLKQLHIYQKSSLKKLNPYLDENNLLRIGGRLSNSDMPYNQAHPLILPPKEHITSLIIKNVHQKLLHTGIQNTLANVRLKYWPINGRCEVKKVIHACTRCIRFRAQVCGQQMASLPSPRVSQSRAFLHVGIDYSGAMDIRSSMHRNSKYSKGYICLFVCLATKALHLELVTDLSTQAFVCALKRFISRRGMCSTIYSDNASNFRGTRAELHQLYTMFGCEKSYSQIVDFCTMHSIKFHFQIPLASHMGGLYEAGIKSVKSLLKRHLYATKLTYELLYTLLVQIEGILNSRPLCTLSDTPNDLTCLTPAHFIIGNSLIDIPEPSLLTLPENRLDVYQRITKLKQKFWKQFYYNYLSELQPRNKWYKPQENLKIGDIVIIKDETTPPIVWPLGKIVSLNINKKDNLVRSVTVQTSKGTYDRPIHKLVVLPSQ